jgi:ABC-type xylose transport system permease subunit
LSDAFNELGQGYLQPEVSAVFLSGVVGLALFFELRGKWLNPRAWLGSAPVMVLGGAAFYSFQNYRGIPYPVLIFGLLAFVGSVLLNRVRFGRFVMALGGNPEAAWLAGVPTRQVTFWIYVAMGLLAGLSGSILSARLNGALPTAGELFELDAIAAVVIGGTSLLGGVGSVRGSIIGAFFIGAMNNGMSLMDITEFYQKVIKGVIIILAVWFDTRQQGSAKKT